MNFGNYPRVTTTVATDGAISAAPTAVEKAGIGSVIASGLASPLNIFAADDKVLISKREAGVGAALWAGVGVLAGEFWGHARAAAGKKALVKVFS